jgi:hypothetical protein
LPDPFIDDAGVQARGLSKKPGLDLSTVAVFS